ncbi:pentapeptide repeat-containing protein [Actinomadura decatromicini]|uniref:Pentapeptide repeat-containing protein n=1 Tax=Actinomadura decatromicini TaxID=2604572 RepID=A0A5D3FFB6_9ACTN|nr:pentapeptide repeat-containing protein [Actinomadura decatromicini]TYK46704.1 pentapeptide repeat-containing protein [Actinomadura decatromicini]
MAGNDVRARPKRLKEPVAPKIPSSLEEVGGSGAELAHDGVYLSTRFCDVDLSAQDVEDVEFERCRFQDTRFSGTMMRRAGFADVEFTSCDLANLRLVDSRIFNAVVQGSRLTGTSMSGCGLRDVLFVNCRADLSSFRFGRFKSVVFRDCNLTDANFQGAELGGVRFERCKLTGAQFSGANMKGARLSECDLYGVNGIQSFEGATVPAADAQALLFALAAAMGITIED